MGAAPNSPEAIAGRVARGRVSWTGPVVLSFARTALAFLAQGSTWAVLRLGGVPVRYEDAGRWFTVHGTLVDLGSLALLWFFLRREGLRITDLFRSGRERSLLNALAWLVPLLLLFGAVGFLTAAVTGFAVYGTAQSQPPVSALPFWAALYSTLVWPLLWGITEQLTYDGYAAPRLAAMGRTRWVLAIVCVGWALQHVALPFRADAAFWAYRFFPALAVAVTSVAVYLRTRRLLPLVLMHWVIDAGTGALTFLPPS